MPNDNGKTLVGVINEAKEELKEFLDTRLQMLRSEMKPKLSVWKLALPMFVVAVFIAVMGFILLSVALVAAIAVAVGWGWSFLIVGAFYWIVAGLIALLAYGEIRAEGVAPQRTLRVLKQDKLVFENEARAQL